MLQFSSGIHIPVWTLWVLHAYAAQNFSVLNRIALNLLKQYKSSKRGIHGKRLNAGWDNDYLLHLLGN